MDFLNRVGCSDDEARNGLLKKQWNAFKMWNKMKSYIISGLVDNYRIKTKLFAISPNHAIKVFQQKYPDATDIYVIQDLFKSNKWL